MPNYGIPQAGPLPAPNQGLNLTALLPGDQPFYLFNAESPTAPQASVAFAREYNAAGGGPTNILFTVSWVATPTATLGIQGSNVDIDGQYQTLQTITNQQNAFYADGGAFTFYRAKLLTQSAGGAVTVIAQR